MSARLPLKIGSSDAKGDDVTHWQKWAKGYAPAYVELMGAVDGYYGTSDSNFTKEMQRRLVLPQTGVFDALTASKVGYKGAGGAVVTPPKQRPGAWIYTMPGSGANWSVGPSFQVGIHAEARHGFRHQPVDFAQGGYLGLMGGDSSLSYVESNADMKKSLYWLHDNNPDLQNLLGQLNRGERATQPLDLVYSGYSKSADGLEDWLEEAFGPGGRYEKARGWIRLVINFGNPSKQKDKDGGAPGWNPPGWGIARKIRPQWLKDKTVSITNPMDFYAVVPDSDDIRPTFYAEIIKAEAELPYFVHLLSIGIKVATNLLGGGLLGGGGLFGGGGGALSSLGGLLGGGLGGLGGGLSSTVLAGLAGLGGSSASQLTSFMGLIPQSAGDTDVDAKLVELFTIQGVITHLDDLIGLIAALPGLQNHGMYHVPFPELGNRSGEQVGRDLIDLFVAGKL